MNVLKTAIVAANAACYTYFAEDKLDTSVLDEPIDTNDYDKKRLYPVKICPNICVSITPGCLATIVPYGKAPPEIQLEFLLLHAANPHVYGGLLWSGVFVRWGVAKWIYTLDGRHSLYDTKVFLWGGGVP